MERIPEDQYSLFACLSYIVFTPEVEPEPLCGAYTAKGLTRVYRSYKTNQLTKHSMRYVPKCLSLPLFMCPMTKKIFRQFQ
jgi:hypothetical protein